MFSRLLTLLLPSKFLSIIGCLWNNNVATLLLFVVQTLLYKLEQNIPFYIINYCLIKNSVGVILMCYSIVFIRWSVLKASISLSD